MKKPEEATLQEFNKGGIFFLDEWSIQQIAKAGEKWLGIEVQIAIMTEQEPSIPDFSFSLVSKRGVATLATDWAFVKDHTVDGQSVLSFSVWQRLPDAVTLPDIEPGLCMSFMDLCFYTGNEAVPEGFKPDTFTLPLKGATMTDLGWYLPSRYVDATVDALGKLNDVVLAGQMEHALLYTIEE